MDFGNVNLQFKLSIIAQQHEKKHRFKSEANANVFIEPLKFTERELFSLVVFGHFVCLIYENVYNYIFWLCVHQHFKFLSVLLP